jgi:hypothetical protein
MAKEDPKKLLREVGEEALSIQESINSLSGALNKNLKEFNKVTGDTQKIFNNALNTSTNLGKQLSEINANSLKNSKERKSLEDQLIKSAKEITSLERQRDQFMRKAQTARGAEQKSLLKIAGLLGDAVIYSKEQVANAERLNKVYVDIEKNLGLTGKILDGINKIPILNKFIDTKKALEAANEEASKLTGNRWSVMSAALKSLGSSLKKNLTDPLVLIGAAGGLLSTIVKLFNEFDKRAIDIGRNFGTTPENARKTAQEFKRISADSANLLSTTTNLTESFNDLNSVAGTYANFTQETLEAYNDLVKGVGISKEAALAQYKISFLQGKNFKDITVQITGQVALQKSQNKIALSDKEIMESIAKTTAVQRLNIKGGAEGLVRSVIEAKKLGAEFNQLDAAASSLLNFEDSIGAELEAELLTGQNLNLEKARTYALNNDIAGLAKEITNQGITAEKFSKMNRIQQESIAKSLGFQRDEFGQMLENQEMLNAANKLGAKDVNDLAAQYAKAADKEAFLSKLGDDKLKSQVQNITFQEKLNNLLEKAKDIFVTQLEPLFTSILNGFDKFIKNGGINKIADIAKGVANSFMSIGKFLVGPVGKILGGLAAFGALKMLVGGIPVRVVGSGPTGGGAAGGMGGGFMSNFFQKGTAGTFYKGGQFLPGGGQAPKGGITVGGTKGGLTGMGAGMLGLGATLAGQAIGGTSGNILSATGQGAMMGSMFGPMGALVGAGLGLAGSGISAYYEHQNASSAAASYAKDKEGPAASRIRQRREAMASTNAMDSYYESLTGHNGGGEGIEKTNMLLEKLVSQTEKGGVINIDGNKAGTYQARAIYGQA